MLDRLRHPLLILALVALALAFLVEVGAGILVPKVATEPLDLGAAMDGPLADDMADLDDDEREEALGDAKALQAAEDPPGLGIPAVALLDVLLVFTMVLVALGLLMAERITGRLQGVATVIVAFLVLLASIGVLIRAFVEVVVMLALLMAVPFGTLTYLALYGSFPTGAAAAVLGTTLFLKIAFAVLLVLAHQRFLQNKGLVLLIVTSLVASLVVMFLHGIVPRFLVSITDGIGAIVAAVLTLIWAIVLLIGGIVAVIKALRVDRALKR